MKKINGHGAAEEFLPGNAGNDGFFFMLTGDTNSAASHITRQYGVVDDGLGCRSAHPDTGAGGQHRGDVSHQPPPQRIEVRVSLVSLVLVCFVFRLAGIWPSLSKGHIAVHVRPDMHVRVPDECAVVSMDTLSIYE